MFESILETIGRDVGSWMYLIAAFLVFAEAAFLLGLVFPGETALLVAGVFCNHAYGHLNVVLMLVIACVAAIAGDTVGYEFGRHYGRPLRRSRLGEKVGEKRWHQGDVFLEKHGGKAVFLGRLVALMRALMPSMAGMSGMHYPTFLRWNAAGGILWASACVLLGWGFSSALSTISSALTWFPIAAVVVVVLVYGGMHLRKRRKEKTEKLAV